MVQRWKDTNNPQICYLRATQDDVLVAAIVLPGPHGNEQQVEVWVGSTHCTESELTLPTQGQPCSNVASHTPFS